MLDRSKGIGVFARFTAAFSVVLIALMVMLAIWINASMLARAQESAGEDAANFLEGMLQPFLVPAGEISALVDNTDALKVLLAQAFLSEGGVRANFRLINIWNLNGDLVFTSNEGLEPVEASDKALAAARGGMRWSAIWHLKGNLHSNNDAQLMLGVFSPLRRSGTGKIAAVVASYQDTDFTAQELQGLRADTWTALGSVLMLMLASLYALWFTASRTINGQHANLIDRVEEARKLANQNARLRSAAEASRRLISQSNDRYLERIGSEIHDGPLQTLSALLLSLGLNLDNSHPEGLHNKTTKTAELALGLYGELQAVSAGLILPDIAERPLSNAFIEAALRHERATSTNVTCRLRNLPPDLSAEIKVGCYRIVQEALNNCFKHAGGAEQKVFAFSCKTHLRIVVQDAGPGLGVVRGPGSRLGLIGMKNRVAALSGVLSISSKKERGTTVRATIPLAQA